jgi:dihydrofolate synthase/folylpolyglutamate synthase
LENTLKTKAVLQLKPQKKAQPSIFASEVISENYPSDLKGITKFIIRRLFQTIELLNAQEEFIITKDHIKTGLISVVKNTGLQGDGSSWGPENYLRYSTQ